MFITFSARYMAPELAGAYLKAGPGRARDREMIPRPAMDVWSMGA